MRVPRALPLIGLAATLVAAIGLPSCTDDTDRSTQPTPDTPLEDCPDSVTVTVSPGSPPTFLWEPECRLFFLLVEPAKSGTDLWSVVSDSVNAIEPPVVYGVVPHGARELDSPATLVSGASYKIVLARFTGPGPEEGEVIGTQTFVFLDE